MNGPATNPPTCPRCGYDQSGAVATWTTSCPLDGTCPECGLAFRWPDVFHPDRDRVRGFFEHTRGLRRSLLAVPRTALLAARPWVFWKRVQMHMAPRLGRAVLWLALLCIGCWLFKALIGVGFVALEAQLPGTAVGRGVSRGTPLWFFMAAELTLPFGNGFWMPSGHPVWVWSIPWIWTQGNWVLLASTLLWPITFVLLPHTRQRARLRKAHLCRAFVYSWVWLLVCDLGWLFARLHLAIFDARLLAGWSNGRQFRTVFYDASDALWDWERSGLFFIIPVWLWIALWWFTAMRRGFQLKHAIGVALSLGVINALATALLWAMSEIAKVAT